MIIQRSLIINRTPLDIPILLFLLSQILSTIFSIDHHTSLFGYYSRSNGGLFSIICYLLLFYAFVSNINKDQAFKMLKFTLIGGVVVALWAIPEHLGISPSCAILRGDLTADCWVQDVQARVFATLGQPNWLAAYLGMLIFPALYFFLQAEGKRQLIGWYLVLVCYYLAFTFTYSRGAMLGVLAGLVIFTTLYVLPLLEFLSLPQKWLRSNLTLILITFLAINIIYGSALTRFQLTNLLPKQNLQPTNTKQTQTAGITQLENGGTESGQIRLIVWKGALDIFKHYPIFGSGVETFAYSYYQFRPSSHNLVSEWDFLYNKAHNEFLNYLATTGIVGFVTYIAILVVFIYWSLSKILSPLETKKDGSLLISVLLAGYISYLIQNFFGFSVVTVALLFYLFPAFAFVLSDWVKPLTINPKLWVLNIIYRRRIYTQMVMGLVFLFSTYLLSTTLGMWSADQAFAIGERANETGNPGRAYNYLVESIKLNPREPFYRNELGYAAAGAAVSLKETDATLSAQLKDDAIRETENSLQMSPKNTSFWRTAIRTYYMLSEFDKSFTEKAVYTIDQTIALAPTDPKLYYNKAIILGQMDRNIEAINALQKAIELKSNYREAYYSLALFYFDQKDNTRALENMEKVLKFVPNDPEVIKKLNEWGQQGLATTSGTKK